MIDLTKRYVTRGGQEVTLVSDKGSNKYPIIGLIENAILPACWTRTGKSNWTFEEDSLDLVEVKEKKKVWVVLYYGPYGAVWTATYNSPEEAAEYKDVCGKYIKTVEIEYEVGE